MHHPKPVHLATRSANSSTLPVTYPTVATQEVILDLDLDAVASQIRISNIEILNKFEIRIAKCSKPLENLKGYIDFWTICCDDLKFLF